MPSKVIIIIIVIEFMFLGINIFWALLRAHFNPHLTARATKHIYAQEHKLYCFIAMLITGTVRISPTPALFT